MATGRNLCQGAVYNHYLKEQMDFSDEELEEVVQDWEGKNLASKVLNTFNPFVDYELRAKAAGDILEARKNPGGETAQKINWKIEDYRDEENSDEITREKIHGMKIAARRFGEKISDEKAIKAIEEANNASILEKLIVAGKWAIEETDRKWLQSLKEGISPAYKKIRYPPEERKQHYGE